MAVGLFGLSLEAVARPYYPAPFVQDDALDALQRRVRAPGAAVEDGCRKKGEGGCQTGALDRIRKKLAPLGNGAAKGDTARVLHLGDSHVAADFITARIRRDFQRRYGDGGRGFVHPAQRWGYGGRLVNKRDAHWRRHRVVDGGKSVGRPYGFSGNSLTARRRGASLSYRVRPDDEVVRLFFGRRGPGPVTVWLDKTKLGRFSAKGASPVVEIPLPARKARRFKRGPSGNTLRIQAHDKGVVLYGLSFERRGPGIQYSSIGPVGADAKVYLQMEPKSFARHLRAYDPDLVVYMVGGNDALKIRKRWTTLARVRRDHERLLGQVRAAVPDADCLLWAPMLAGRRQGKAVTTKRFLTEVRSMQREVANAQGCAFWDTMDAMGGPKSIRRWVPHLAKDLIHPRKSAADLLGRMFVRGWMKLE